MIKQLAISVNSIAITPDGKYVLIGGDRKVEIIDATSDQIINTIPLATSPVGLAVTSD
ncbi:MAG: hypothetical protein HY002_13510, partial [Candidatus Rokubacteria bacterium]|nr:hypothetical protein [Candidatus Rokubacteria bacterium]